MRLMKWSNRRRAHRQEIRSHADTALFPPFHRPEASALTSLAPAAALTISEKDRIKDHGAASTHRKFPVEPDRSVHRHLDCSCHSLALLFGSDRQPRGR